MFDHTFMQHQNLYLWRQYIKTWKYSNTIITGKGRRIHNTVYPNKVYQNNKFPFYASSILPSRGNTFSPRRARTSGSIWRPLTCKSWYCVLIMILNHPVHEWTQYVTVRQGNWCFIVSEKQRLNAIGATPNVFIFRPPLFGHEWEGSV